MQKWSFTRLKIDFIVAVRSLEKSKITDNFAAETCEVTKSESMKDFETESESSDNEIGRTIRPKKLKVTGLHHWRRYTCTFPSHVIFICWSYRSQSLFDKYIVHEIVLCWVVDI